MSVAGKAITGTTGMRTLLLIVLIVLFLGAIPAWPYSAGWGYYPSGGIGLLLVVLLVFLFVNREV